MEVSVSAILFMEHKAGIALNNAELHCRGFDPLLLKVFVKKVATKSNLIFNERD